ncbi:unnamed protein product [Peronospora farinosa]|uniref:WD repeat-containing protein 89 n=1 Tax=Peronospora farinosa TaxID=134698 RepID=A0AAV0SSV8_9STRA|nr:unnamed protein product [Peronospora farinosa]CAI5707545.1 unnamed protein product [Peronospora farinosa]
MDYALDRGDLKLVQTAVVSFVGAQVNGSADLLADPSVEFDYDYILDCQPTAHRSGLALALSTRKLQLRSLETLALQHEFHAHNSTIHEIWTSQSSPYQLATCSSDECVKLWDTRTALPALVVPVGQEVWSLSINHDETLLAAGTDNLVLFYDVRTGAKLGEYGESHVDAVTKVRFHPTQPAFVVTASEDGVVCCFDCRIPDEDEALESILNVESAVTTLGFFGELKENIYCLTGTETLDLWNIWTAKRLHHYDTIRDDCNSNGLATDYLIDCVYNDQSNDLVLLVGNHDGDVNAVNIGTNAASAGKLQHVAALKGGHKACIRCIYYDPESTTMFTGGEDTRLCKWVAAEASNGSFSTSSTASFSKRAMGCDSAGIRKARKSSRPY